MRHHWSSGLVWSDGHLWASSSWDDEADLAIGAGLLFLTVWALRQGRAQLIPLDELSP